MINYSDLIGLSYKFGAKPSDGNGCTDCFSLCMEIRERLGLKLLRTDFQWVYDKYTEHTLSGRQILKLLLKYGSVVKTARPGAIFEVAGGAMLFPMGVVLPNDDCLFIGASKMVIAAPLSALAPTKFFWAD
jgi:hypothetical protein